MKKLILFVFAISTVTIVNAQKKVKGNGNMTKITRSTTSYNGVKCAGSFDYILEAGTEGNITIEGEENLLDYIITEVKDGVLIVKTKKMVSLRTSYNKTITVTIPFQDISSVSLAGSGDLWSKNTINADTFKASISGSGDVSLTIQANSIEASVAGSGDLTLKGNTTNLEASIAGSGDFHGFDLEADNTTVSVAGSGDADVVSRKYLKARVSGSGDIEYKGNPEKEDTKVAGSGSISN